MMLTMTNKTLQVLVEYAIVLILSIGEEIMTALFLCAGDFLQVKKTHSHAHTQTHT